MYRAAIGLPVYNGGKTLKTAIDSLLSQSYRNGTASSTKTMHLRPVCPDQQAQISARSSHHKMIPSPLVCLDRGQQPLGSGPSRNRKLLSLYPLVFGISAGLCTYQRADTEKKTRSRSRDFAGPSVFSTQSLAASDRSASSLPANVGCLPEDWFSCPSC
jgi:hypothetical protein